MAKKKVVKPETEDLKRRIKAVLEKKYPQMYETLMTRGQKKEYLRLSPGDRKEYKKMIGKTMKKEYQ
ncbi:hypothetical protein KAR91_78785 [Candidatus Pacearchaeota archaeon]|nr:hypothetical protein [Candidatus Pacearchaeota archaeon]